MWIGIITSFIKYLGTHPVVSEWQLIGSCRVEILSVTSLVGSLVDQDISKSSIIENGSDLR